MVKCSTCDGTGYTNSRLIPVDVMQEGRRAINNWAYKSVSSYTIPKNDRARLCPCCGDEDEMWWSTGMPGFHEGTCRGLTYEQRNSPEERLKRSQEMQHLSI